MMVSEYREALARARKVGKGFRWWVVGGSQTAKSIPSVDENVTGLVFDPDDRWNLGEYLQHLSIAKGSLKELETHLLIASRLNYCAANEIVPALDTCAEIGRMLSGLIQKLRQRKFQER